MKIKIFLISAFLISLFLITKIFLKSDFYPQFIQYPQHPKSLPITYILITSSPTPSLTPTSTPIPTPTRKPTATPTKTPTPIKVSNTDLDNWFSKYANLFSIDRNMLVKIAVCESKLNPYARSLDYGGLYQFSTNTWINTRRTMNLDQNPDLRFNPEESIKTAAFKISTGGINAWQNCIK